MSSTIVVHLNLVLATKEEIEGYRAKAQAFVNSSNMWNSCSGSTRGAIMEYLANSEGKTVFAHMVGKNAST